MSTTPVITAARREELRLAAETLLKQGGAPPMLGPALGPDALMLLYRLASEPASAADALKLLHELQAHQVELDLQHEQLETNERDFGDTLARYQALFDSAPVGYLVLNLQGRILEANAEAARLLGTEAMQMSGRPLASLLGSGGDLAFAGLMKRLRDGAEHAHCQLRAEPTDGSIVILQVAARIAPSAEAILLIMSDQGRLQQG